MIAVRVSSVRFACSVTVPALTSDHLLEGPVDVAGLLRLLLLRRLLLRRRLVDDIHPGVEGSKGLLRPLSGLRGLDSPAVRLDGELALVGEVQSCHETGRAF